MNLIVFTLLIINPLAITGCSSNAAGSDAGRTDDSGRGGAAGAGGLQGSGGIVGGQGRGGYAIGGSDGGITVTPNCGAQYEDCSGDLVEVCAQDCGGVENVARATCSLAEIEIRGDGKPLCQCLEGACSGETCVKSIECDWQDIEGDFVCEGQCNSLCGEGNPERPAFCLSPGVCECYCLNGGLVTCLP